MDGPEVLTAPPAQAELPAPETPPETGLPTQPAPTNPPENDAGKDPQSDGGRRVEPLIDPEAISRSIDQAYSDATNLVLSLYSTKETIVTQFLESKNGKRPEANEIKTEIVRRQAFLDDKSNSDLKTTLDLIVKAQATGIAADKAIIAATVNTPQDDCELIEKKVIARYYNRETGIYYEVDKDDKPLEPKKEIRLSLTVKPVIDALEQIKSQTKPDKADENTPEAKQAKNLFMLLKNRMYPSNDGGFLIDHSIDRAKVETHEFKKANESVVNLGLETLDAHLKGIGEKGIRNEKGQIDLEKVSQLVKELDPKNLTGLGRLTLFLVAHAKCTDPALANKFLPTLIYQELTQLVQGEFASQNSQLQDKIKQLKASEKFNLYLKKEDSLGLELNELQKNLKALIDHTVAEGGFDPEQRHMDVNQFTKVITMGFLIQDKVDLDMQGRAYINEPSKPKKGEVSLKETLSQMEAAGVLTHFEKQLILNLATQKAAGKIFQALGFTPEVLERLKDKDCAQYFANEAVVVLKNRLGEKLPKEKAEEYRMVLQEILAQSISHYDKKFGLANWFKAFGLLALILGPSGFSMLNIGVEEEREQR